MKHEVFILGGQINISEDKEGMVEREREDWEREQREDRDRENREKWEMS